MNFEINKPHAIMFHHFHNEKHPIGQGSLDKAKFISIINFYSKKFKIISADLFLNKFINNDLKNNEVCISFDDNLKCQYEIALPVLEKLKLNAFWFLYTSPLDGSFEKLELYRYFRSVYFNSFKEFYESFFKELKTNEKYNFVFKNLLDFNYDNYLKEYSFYSKEDRIFRHTRDNLLGQEEYFKVMDVMIEKSGLKLNNKLHELLWMNSNDIINLKRNGHVIGLHSHTHPTKMAEKSFSFQYENYKKNKFILENIIGDKIISMSHPCNSYNNKTIDVLVKLGIKLGFRSNPKIIDNSILEIPRIDHSEILKLI